MPRPTIRLISEKSGFSGATVSLALRGHPRITESTREQILKVARELGYIPDPSISKLMTHIRSARNPESMTTLALLNATRSRNFQGLSKYHKYLMQGMEEQAHALGYRLEPFWLFEKNMTERRMSQILESRGIQGIIIPPIKDSGTILGFNWEKFSAVTVGYSLLQPRFNRVVGNQRQAIFTALYKLLQTGHKRIGAVLNQQFDSRLTFISSSVLHWFHSLIPPRRRVPFLKMPNVDMPMLEEWMTKHKPDAIVTHFTKFAEHLEEAGYRIPDDFSVIEEGSRTEKTHITGCYISPYDIGQRTIKILDSQLLQNEFGLPKVPVTSLMEMQWHEGKTLLNRGKADPLTKLLNYTAW